MTRRRRSSFRVRVPLWTGVLLAAGWLLTQPTELQRNGSRAPALAPSPAADQTEAWTTVAWIADGDTVRIASGELVRYIGIDTPELHHPRKPVQPLAHEAKAANERLVKGRRVRLEFDVQRRDKYDRLLAYVYLEDGTFVNAELLRQGYARLLTIPPNVRHVDVFQQAQHEAREAGRGLWAPD